MTRPWLDPELVAQGREPMHAISREPGMSLDGSWRFQLREAPEAALSDAWDEVVVPGCWTRQGTTDRPHYTNVLLPFRNEPPHLPARNPTGVYEREFELPEAWAGRRVVLHVGAAESVVIVELNGARVGVGKDSHLASEFALRRYLRRGVNSLRLTVVKWSDATFLEDPRAPASAFFASPGIFPELGLCIDLLECLADPVLQVSEVSGNCSYAGCRHGGPVHRFSCVPPFRMPDHGFRWTS